MARLHAHFAEVDLAKLGEQLFNEIFASSTDTTRGDHHIGLEAYAPGRATMLKYVERCRSARSKLTSHTCRQLAATSNPAGIAPPLTLDLAIAMFVILKTADLPLFALQPGPSLLEGRNQCCSELWQIVCHVSHVKGLRASDHNDKHLLLLPFSASSCWPGSRNLIRSWD